MSKLFKRPLIEMALPLAAWLGYTNTGALSATPLHVSRRPAIPSQSRLLQVPSDPACNAQGVPALAAIDSMYVTQAGQFSKYVGYGNATPPPPVPIVVGRQAELRVFARNISGGSQPNPPPVIRIFINEQRFADITEPSGLAGDFPTTVTESEELNPNDTYNVTIGPSYLTAPATKIRAVVLDAKGNETQQCVNLAAQTINTGSIVVNAVPLIIAGNTGQVTPDLTDLLSTLLPFAAVTVNTVGAVPVNPDKNSDITDQDILDAINLKYATAGLYYGVAPQVNQQYSFSCGASYHLGSGPAGHYTAFGVDDNEYPVKCYANYGHIDHVATHELGHTLGLYHAPSPCHAAPPPIDPWFMQHGAPDGQMVSDGWNFAPNQAHVINGATTQDMMGYCAPFWIGAHGWGTIIADYTPPAATVRSRVPRLRLTVIASTRDGRIDDVNGSSAIVPEPGKPPTPDGDVLFEALNPAGHVIGAWRSSYVSIHGDFSLRPSREEGGAEVSVTITPQFERQIAALRATYRGRSVTRHARLPGPIQAKVVAIDADHVGVTFDCSHYTELNFHHATEIEIQDYLGAALCDGRVTAGTGYGVFANRDRDVYVNFQDGVKTVAHLVKFHVIGR